MDWAWLQAPDYWPARLVVQRLLALTYLLGFLTWVLQGRALLGEHGLTPIPRFLAATGFRRAPSLFQLHYTDRFFLLVGWLGVLFSGALLFGLTDVLPLWAGMVVWALVWVLYLSVVNVGQIWYSFGWESLLLEAGFLAVFLGPAQVAPPAPVLWLLVWLLFRVEFGAGLIKVRGDPCWRDLTCLHYHHETQPLPGPLSRRFHHLPGRMHKVEVLSNHVTQLIVPFALFAPQPAANVAALIVVLTQGWLVISGNFAWLNFITIALGFAAMDSSVLGPVVPGEPSALQPPPLWYAVVVLLVTAGVLVLSYWPVRNMLGRGQVMNRSFNKLHLVNTYGAFGSVTRTRYEVVVQGTADTRPGERSEWLEYEFRAKPGDPRRQPPQIAPYHLRLDWLMWFAAISPGYAQPWLPRLLRALLRNDPLIIGLLRRNPFPDEPPGSVRAVLYRYRFSDAEEKRATGRWWVRSEVGEYLPAMSLPPSATG